MATVREYTSKRTGKTTYQVRYRLDGKQSSSTFPTHRDAKKFGALVDAVGPAEALRQGQPAAASSASSETVAAAAYIAAWMKELAADGNSEKAIFNKKTALSGALDYPVESGAPRRRYVNISEAARYLNVSPRTIQAMLADGRLTAHRFGTKLVRIDLNEIDQIDSVQNPPAATAVTAGELELLRAFVVQLDSRLARIEHRQAQIMELLSVRRGDGDTAAGIPPVLAR